MSNIKLTMNNWHIKDNMPYINLGNSGENNVVNLEIKVDELIEATNDTIVTYFLDIYNKQDEHTARTQLCDVNVNALTLTIPLTRSFLTNDGVKLLQVRCITSDKQYNEISTQLSNKFHAIVGQGNYNTKYDIDNLGYGEQVVVSLNSKIKDIVSNIKQIETGGISQETLTANITQAVDDYLEQNPSSVNADTVTNIVSGYFTEHKNELKGDKGDTGNNGINGINGKSAYEIAVDNGFEGTQVQWLASLKGEKGDSGEGSSYDDTKIKQEIADIWKVRGELGAKNLIPYPYYFMSITTAGITFNVNDDTSITANGTSTGWAGFYLINATGAFMLKKGKYLMSYKAKGNSPFYMDLTITNTENQIVLVKRVTNTTNEAEIVITDELEEVLKTAKVQLYFYVNRGTILDNVTIYPMIRLASDIDDTWQPYAPTNYQLYQKFNTIVSGKSAYQIAVDNGYRGTESEWLASLKGEKGDKGDTGAQGIQGEKGESALIGKSHRTVSTVGQWIAALVSMDYINGEKYIVKLHSNGSLKDLTMCSLIDDKSLNQSNRVTIYSNEFVSYDDTPFYFVANENDETQAHVFAIFGQATVENQTLDMSVYTNTTIKEQDKTIPPYYFVDNYLDNKIDEIRDNSCITSGINFAFITDLHFNFNAMKSNLLLNYVFDKTTVPFVVCGGDIVESYGTEEHAINAANAYIEYANSLHKPIFTIHGNHDLCIRTSAQDPSGYSAPEAVLNNYIINTADKTRINGVNGKRYYYIDDDFEKVRMIVLDDYVELMDATKAGGSYNDEGIGLDQIIWLKDVALNADGYTFIIMTHGGGDDSLIGYNRIMKNTVYPILKAINNRTAFSITVDNTKVTGDYTSTNNYVACVLAGHTHRDESGLSEGLLTITTACDARYADDPNNGARKLATITEQAFDIFSIDTTTRKIKTVRIGAGHNREWTYAQVGI